MQEWQGYALREHRRVITMCRAELVQELREQLSASVLRARHPRLRNLGRRCVGGL